jgi:hypothetical protein
MSNLNNIFKLIISLAVLQIFINISNFSGVSQIAESIEITKNTRSSPTAAFNDVHTFKLSSHLVVQEPFIPLLPL